MSEEKDDIIKQQQEKIERLKAQLASQLSNDVSTAIDAIPIPPVASLDDIEIKTVTPQTEPSKFVKITFSEIGKYAYVKRQIYEKYIKLQDEIIVRSFDKFMKYVFPLLNDECLEWNENFDDINEIGTVIDEIDYYGIELSDKQICNITDACNFAPKINQFKKIIENPKINCFKSYTKFIDSFKVYWDQYIAVYSSQHKDSPKYQALSSATFDLIDKTLEYTTDYYVIGRTNIKLYNIIYKFLDMFEKTVIKKDETYIKHEIEINVTSSVITKLEDGVKSIIEMLPLTPDQKALADKLKSGVDSVTKFLSV